MRVFTRTCVDMDMHTCTHAAHTRTGVCKNNTPSRCAFALQSRGRDRSPAPDLAFRKLIFPRFFCSGGVFFSQTPVIHVSMYMCVCVCLSLSLYVYIYIYIYTRICVYMYISLSLYIYIYMYLSLSLYIYIYIVQGVARRAPRWARAGLPGQLPARRTPW